MLTLASRAGPLLQSVSISVPLAARAAAPVQARGAAVSSVNVATLLIRFCILKGQRTAVVKSRREVGPLACPPISSVHLVLQVHHVSVGVAALLPPPPPSFNFSSNKFIFFIIAAFPS